MSAHISGTVEPGSTVLVNGKDVPVDAGGNFAATISLNEGANKVNVTVTDPAGNTKSVEKTVNRKAAMPITMILVVVIILVIVVAAGGAMALRGRGRKPQAAPEEPVRSPKAGNEPPEAEEVKEE